MSKDNLTSSFSVCGGILHELEKHVFLFKRKVDWDLNSLNQSWFSIRLFFLWVESIWTKWQTWFVILFQTDVDFIKNFFSDWCCKWPFTFSLDWRVLAMLPQQNVDKWCEPSSFGWKREENSEWILSSVRKVKAIIQWIKVCAFAINMLEN